MNGHHLVVAWAMLLDLCLDCDLVLRMELRSDCWLKVSNLVMTTVKS